MHMQSVAQANSSRQLVAGRGERSLGVDALFGSIELIGARMSFSGNAEIYGEEEPADYVYKVVSGAVRVCKLLDDGRRQITAFCLPGEIFGFAVGDVHRFAAEAITDSRILVVKRSTVVALAARNGEVARQLWAHTARELESIEEHMLLLGCLSAKERVAGFLRMMANRMSDGNDVELPMARQDIADYLGLTVETVSRSISQLVSDATIGRHTSRHIVLRCNADFSQLNA
jgi:CRP/FNR family transcriptional regulator, nitrogen fixation regulation protein